jgi:hypothetical protein
MKPKEKIQIDHDKLKKAIAAGSIIASLVFFDYLSADEWYERDEKGILILRKRDLIREIFD